VLARAAARCGLEQELAGRELLHEVLEEAGLRLAEVGRAAATGSGRKAFRGCDLRVNDVTASARAANALFPGASSVLDVGAEASRGIKTDGRGRVLDSALNDKCAAGAGTFVESMALALGMSLEEFGAVSLLASARISMNAHCVVFAESEVISLIHSGTGKEDVARAVLDAVASRVSSTLRRIGPEGRIVLLGGLARIPGFVACLKEALNVDEVDVPEGPEFAAALGAALIAAEPGR
jgi:benzoyl-CoA reductase subunit D